MAAPCARSTAGAPATPAATVIAPSAELCRNWRRLQFTRSFGMTESSSLQRACLDAPFDAQDRDGGRPCSCAHLAVRGSAAPAALYSVTFTIQDAGGYNRVNRRAMNDRRTLFDKVWAAHEIVHREDGESLLWVDRHFVHEGSFHAFSRLAEPGANVAEPGLTFGVADHYVPTRGSRSDIANPEIASMVRQVEENTAKHNVKLFGLGDPRQ